ncbi:protein-disulfide reductase DsbD family protein [Kistimonas asteriae]|uniref:protein-disulfide reductase DsbD family protein n=1 Tax=Kistimonas asteriae TaxID=517724 RepID=UPI001BA62B1D|nr:protein-disulfide reductase DsbD domain-containing protein [Kistimonas asteriae]
MKKQFYVGLVTLCLLLMSRVGFALSTEWLVSPQQPNAKVRLLLTGETDPVAGTVTGGLEVQLNDDWKTYWRSPGEGGIAPEAKWLDSGNLKQVEWLWPLPERFELLGIHALGYKKTVVFPLVFQVEDFDQPVRLLGDFRLSSCTTICVLTDYQLDLSFIPSALTPDPAAAFAVDKALSRVPTLMPDSGIGEVTAVWDASQQIVRVTAVRSDGWKTPDVIIDGMEDVIFGVPDIRYQGEQLKATVSVSSWLGDVDLNNQTLAVTVISGDYAKEIPVVVRSGTVADDTNDNSLLYLIGLAFLGGLILNLMPCVLPVLGMKLSSLVMASGQSQGQVRRQFLSVAAGILFSFWLLAAGLLALKTFGAQIGWGIQFQNPWFIGFMVLVTTAFAANLLSCFDIRLPVAWSSRIAQTGDDGLAGHFIQGMFATLLATPCSAPFLGTAVAFALVSDPLTLWMIFTSLGIGMAAPYLLVSLRPSLVRLLPKPGPWMNVLRRVLALLLLGTTFWLISLLHSHMSMIWVLLVAAGPVLLLAFSMIRSRQPAVGRGLAFVAALCLSLGLVMSGGWILGAFEKGTQQESVLNWTPFDESKIESHVMTGKVVFVDVTADWCITCKANKASVLNRGAVAEALNAPGVVLMQGDWTRPSDVISQFLNKHNRYGVPFNIVYGPGAKAGIALPVLLTRDGVLNALNQAAGTQEIGK